jgi:PTH1 family peptidyl-tRNA hydrolase
MLLFVGLGNPDKAYARHRHNAGFMAIDAIARAYGAPAFKPRFQGLMSEAPIAGERVLLLKPQTYMNESGRSAGEAARYYKIGLPDIVAFHDELDLAPGKVRVKKGGGNAGHRGLNSLTAHLGNDYRRVRIGIGHPGDKELVHDYVLSDFAKEEMPWAEILLKAIAEHAPLLAAGEDEAFQQKLNQEMAKATTGERPHA